MPSGLLVHQISLAGWLGALSSRSGADACWVNFRSRMADYGLRREAVAGLGEDSRIDFGAFNTVHPELLDILMKNLEEAVVQSDAVILNQQIPAGLSSSEAIEHINEDHQSSSQDYSYRDGHEHFRRNIRTRY